MNPRERKDLDISWSLIMFFPFEIFNIEQFGMLFTNGSTNKEINLETEILSFVWTARSKFSFYIPFICILILIYYWIGPSSISICWFVEVSMQFSLLMFIISVKIKISIESSYFILVIIYPAINNQLWLQNYSGCHRVRTMMLVALGISFTGNILSNKKQNMAFFLGSSS